MQEPLHAELDSQARSSPRRDEVLHARPSTSSPGDPQNTAASPPPPPRAGPARRVSIRDLCNSLQPRRIPSAMETPSPTRVSAHAAQVDDAGGSELPFAGPSYIGLAPSLRRRQDEAAIRAKFLNIHPPGFTFDTPAFDREMLEMMTDEEWMVSQAIWIAEMEAQEKEAERLREREREREGVAPAGAAEDQARDEAVSGRGHEGADAAAMTEPDGLEAAEADSLSDSSMKQLGAAEAASPTGTAVSNSQPGEVQEGTVPATPPVEALAGLAGPSAVEHGTLPSVESDEPLGMPRGGRTKRTASELSDSSEDHSRKRATSAIIDNDRPASAAESYPGARVAEASGSTEMDGDWAIIGGEDDYEPGRNVSTEEIPNEVPQQCGSGEEANEVDDEDGNENNEDDEDEDDEDDFVVVGQVIRARVDEATLTGATTPTLDDDEEWRTMDAL